jgi:hypothetical protein
MWLVNITCSGDAWKVYATEFKLLADKYKSTCVSSKKMPDGTRIMGYKIDDVSDAEAFQEECTSFAGFTAYFESM